MGPRSSSSKRSESALVLRARARARRTSRVGWLVPAPQFGAYRVSRARCPLSPRVGRPVIADASIARNGPELDQATDSKWIRRPSALATFMMVAKLGLPSADRALYKPSRLIPARRASSLTLPERAITPRAWAMKAGSSPASSTAASS